MSTPPSATLRRQQEGHLYEILNSFIPKEEWSDPLLDLDNTPARVLRAWASEFFKGYSPKEEARLRRKFKTFKAEARDNPFPMVVQADVPFTSLCAHHLLPFRGVAHFGYIPDKRVVGLSKIAWVLDHFAARAQIQETLTDQVLDYVENRLHSRGSILVLRAEHLCMACRGPRKSGVATSTAALRGLAMTDASVRSEFYSLIKG
jgi:GTP cyclohydrolase I